MGGPTQQQQPPAVPPFFRTIAMHHPPHSVSYCDKRQTFYASHSKLETITQSHLPSSKTSFLVPRGILRDPTALCYVPAVSPEFGDADTDECDDLYIADTRGCRIFRLSLGEDLSVGTPELLYQSYRSPHPSLHLQSLADYQRDNSSVAARVARKDERMRVRGVAISRSRKRMFWCQGSCVMCCNLEWDWSEQADARRDLLIVAEGSELEHVERMWVDADERWLCLQDSATGEEHRLFLGGLPGSSSSSVTSASLSNPTENVVPPTTVKV